MVFAVTELGVGGIGVSVDSLRNVALCGAAGLASGVARPEETADAGFGNGGGDSGGKAGVIAAC